MNEEEKRDFEEGLKTYYDLKKKYDEKREKERNDIARKKGLSWREKRRMLKKIMHKCINCGQGGGTLFSQTYDEESKGRRLRALCGNNATPCPLDILIYLGNIMQTDELIQEDEAGIDALKKQIIQQKNDVMYGYLNKSEAVAKFEELKKSLTDLTSIYEFALNEFYNKKVDNKEHKEALESCQNNIITNISSIRNLMYEFDKTNQPSFVLEAVDILVNSLEKKLIEGRHLKNQVQYVSYDAQDNTYHLVQQHYAYDFLEENYAKKWGIEKMVIGLSKTTKKTPTKIQTKKIPVIQESSLDSDSDSDSDTNATSDLDESDELVEQDLDTLGKIIG